MNPNILVGIPSRGEVKSDFMMSLLVMYATTMGYESETFSRINMGVQVAKGSILPQSRERLVESAIDGEADYLLFLDDDMYFPQDLLVKMLEHDVDVVACNCPTKRLPTTPTARLWDPKNPAGTPIPAHTFDTKLSRVWRVGTGIMLIKVSALKKVHKPRFAIKWSKDTQDYIGEDWGFCEKLEDKGIKIHIDNELSYQIGHIGDLTYTHDMVEN